MGLNVLGLDIRTMHNNQERQVGRLKSRRLLCPHTLFELSTFVLLDLDYNFRRGIKVRNLAHVNFRCLLIGMT